MKKEEFEFLKTYYNLLKSKSNKDIGSRFLTQIKTLVQSGEISSETQKIIESCIAIGIYNSDITADDLEVIKEFIGIGIYIKEEQEAQRVANKLAEKPNIRSIGTSSGTSDPCGISHSGRSSGGC